MQKPDMALLGERLVVARHRRGWNQSECAREAGVHRPTLALLEDGQKPYIRGDMLYTLAHALQVSADYLLGLTDDPTPPRAKPRRKRPAQGDAGEEEAA